VQDRRKAVARVMRDRRELRVITAFFVCINLFRDDYLRCRAFAPIDTEPCRRSAAGGIFCRAVGKSFPVRY